MNVRRLSLLSAVSLLAAVGVAQPARAAANLACGQVVQASVTLSSDIGPCAGDGLIVNKDGITLDLGGHTIRGNSDPASDQVGVRLASVSGVTVRAGTVTAFDAGIALDNSTSSTVTQIRAIDNKGTGGSNHGDGIVLDGSSNNQILSNEVVGNGPFSGISMVDGANGNVIRSNSIRGNTLVRAEPPQVAPKQENVGVRFDTGASNNVVDSNAIEGNGSHGVNASGFEHTGNVVKNNLIRGNGQVGIQEPGDHYTLSGNLVDHNGYDQFQVPGRPKRTYDGILVFGNLGGGPGVIENNVVRNNARNGIALVTTGFTFFGTYHPPVVDVIRGNTVENNGHDGIFVECDFVADAFPQHVCVTNSPPHEGQHIVANRATGNGGAGAGTSAWDLHDENPGCDSNQWLNNTGGTVKPSCTLRRS